MIFDINLSTGRWPFRDLPLEKLEKLKDKLEKSGISGGAVRSLEAPFSLNIYEANEKLFAACKNFPEFLPVPAVRPDFPLWRNINSRFVVLYPNYHQYSLLAPECVEMVTCLLKKHIIPISPVREEDERGQHPLCQVPPVAADEINALAQLFPEHPFVVLNCYSSEFAALISKNIRADIAFADGFPALRKTLELFDAKRLVFGSHAPFFCINAALSKLRQLASDRDWSAKELI